MLSLRIEIEHKTFRSRPASLNCPVFPQPNGLLLSQENHSQSPWQQNIIHNPTPQGYNKSRSSVAIAATHTFTALTDSHTT